jgi:hypothetical protein
MQLDDLAGSTDFDLEAVKEALGDADVLAVLLASEDDRDEKVILVAIDDNLAIVTRNAYIVRPRIAGVMWDYVEVGQKGQHMGFEGPSSDHTSSLSVRVGERNFKARLSGPDGKEAIDVFEGVALHAGARQYLGTVAVGCPVCGKVGWKSDGRIVRRSDHGDDPKPIYVSLVMSEQGEVGPWVGDCGHAVEADSELAGFLDRLTDEGVYALPPNR